MSLLDELRRKAESISGAQEKDAERLARNAERVDGALRRGFSFFLEMAGYLNVVKPENKRCYVVPNLGNIEGMRESEFFVDYRTTSVLDKPRLEHFYVRYTSSADRVLEKQLDFVAAEKLRTFLWECNLEFRHEDTRSEKGKIVGGSFQVPCILRSEFIFKGDYAGGLILVACRNVEWFGRDEFTYDAEEIEVSLLEEYVKFITGERNFVRQRGRHQANLRPLGANS